MFRIVRGTVVLIAFLGAAYFVMWWLLTARDRIADAESARLLDLSNLRRLGFAVAAYHDAKGHYPPAYVLGPDGKPWHSWRVLLLPYLDEEKLFGEYNFNEPWDGPNNRRLASRIPSVFRSQRAQRKSDSVVTSYLAVVGEGTLWPGAGTVPRQEVTDGEAQTILLVENSGLGVHWMEPRDLEFATMSFGLGRPDGVSSWYQDPAIVTADGSVRRLKRELRPETLRALLTIRGGERLEQNESGQWEWLQDGRDRPPKDAP
jgi:hypothetical protein